MCVCMHAAIDEETPNGVREGRKRGGREIERTEQGVGSEAERIDQLSEK